MAGDRGRRANRGLHIGSFWVPWLHRRAILFTRGPIIGSVTSVVCGLWLLALPRPVFRVRSLPALARYQRCEKSGNVIAGRFELHLAWNLKPLERRVSGS